MQNRFLLLVGLIILFSMTMRVYVMYILYKYSIPTSTHTSNHTSNHNSSDALTQYYTYRLIANIVLFIVLMGIIKIYYYYY